MSEENVEVVRGVYERWAEGDFRAGVELFHPEFEFVLPSGFPESGTYRGVGEMAEYMREFLEPWDRMRIAADELIDAGEAVVASVVQTATGSGSGAATVFRYHQVWTFREDRVVRLENFRERDPALASVGLV